MSDELIELLDTAIYKEIASQSMYIAGQTKTEDAGARVLLKELAEDERKHSQWLTELKDRGLETMDGSIEKVPNLMLSEYFTGGESLEGAGLQETLIFALKREQQSVKFYSQMMGVLRDEDAKRLCERLAHEELKHKLRLEILYEDLFYKAD